MTDALARAYELAEAAHSAGTADAHDYMTMALARAHAGAMLEADTLMETALKLEPRNPAILLGFALVRRQQGFLRDAVLLCDEAISIAPDYADAWRERGAILSAGGSIDEARRSFSQAARLAPNDAASHAGLAALAARETASVEAEAHARRALAIDPQNIVAASSLASTMLASRRAAEVPALLEPLVASIPEASPDRVLASNQLGHAWDQLGDHARAFDCYHRSKSDFGVLHARQAGGRMTHLPFVEAIHAGLETIDTNDWPATPGIQPPQAPKHHIFLMGYPRSGTTLAENILCSLGGVSALEERPTLVDSDKVYLPPERAGIIAGIANFGLADETELHRLREAYWDKVGRSNVPLGGVAFVDMDPLKATRLPLIARLFPNARVLIMRRDPRDVVWSCFRTNFDLTSGTAQYASLDSAARHYDAMMRLTELALAKLPISHQFVRYDALVHDFDVTTKAMCRFVGLEWTEAVRSFDRTAATRGVSTASTTQVRRGLYDGTSQWKPYARWLEPVLPILNPWIEKFGYTNLSMS